MDKSKMQLLRENVALRNVLNRRQGSFITCKEILGDKEINQKQFKDMLVGYLSAACDIIECHVNEEEIDWENVLNILLDKFPIDDLRELDTLFNKTAEILRKENDKKGGD